MNSQLLLKTKIKLPQLFVEQKKIGKNKIVQIAQKEEIIDVDIYKHKSTCFLLVDRIGRRFYLKIPNSKIKINNSNTLKIKEFSKIEDLNETNKLFWENHVAKNATKNPERIVKSWNGLFFFKEEGKENVGLRKPQLGGIHSIASHWSVNKNCGTIVMPTGTGKTETMISILIYQKCKKVLILVPSKVLRNQMFEKFSSLGCLRDIGVVDKKILNPRIALIEHRIKNIKEAEKIVDESNVIIAIPYAWNNFSDDVKSKISEKCSHLFIDEAHHVPAKTWKNVKKIFKDKLILQFTATPFRRDKKRIEGDIIYNYPLGMAQDDGYFTKINLLKLQEFDDNKADEEIAKAAIRALKNDLSKNLDHILMARCKYKTRAEKILDIYKKFGSDYSPIIINSDLSSKEYNNALEKLNKRETQIIICVDMLGEGFDLPNLKIAALHDIHKSLAVTLQFIGRFTRVSKKVGDATVVMNISDPKVGNELEILYAEDADWNKLIRQKSESTIQKEIDFHEFINNFSGELSEHISLWNLRPSFSTLIYETKCENWFPKKFVEIIPEKYKYWYAVNDKEKILVVVISREENVNWGKYKDIKNHSFDLCVAHWSDKYKALFLQCSDYDVINCNKLSKIICGNTTKIKNGEKVFNIFSDMERPLARNLGVSPSRKNISYTMHFGTDITTGLSKIDKAESELNNIFCWGYQGGERVSIGCSAKKGKVWSIGGGPITIWKDWCYKMADKIFDSTIEENKIIQDFLRPRELQGRHRSIPLLVQWSENILKADENKITIFLGENEYKLYDINLEIINYSKDGPVFFKIFSGKQESIYKIQYNRIGCIYSVVKGEEVRIRKYSGDPVPLVDYVENDPIIVMYVDGSFSHNNSHISIPQPNTFFDKNKLNVETWADTNIQIESLGKENKTNSVQYKVSEIFKDDYEIIFNDDASGEAADIIAMRQESNDSFKLHLIHCKFSSDKKPGARIADFYTLCGQAQKCIRWKHNGIGYLVNHMKRRELSWQEDNKTRFLKGNMDVLNKLRKFSRFATNFIFEVTIVQPGLSKQKVSDDIIQLLGSTEDYLIKTSDATFNVICSD